MTLQNISEPTGTLDHQRSLIGTQVGGNWLTPVAMVRAHLDKGAAVSTAADWQVGCATVVVDTADAVLDGTAPPIAKMTDLAALELALYESETCELLGESSEPLETALKCSTPNPFAVLGDTDSCTRTRSLCGKAKTLVSYFSAMGIKITGELPSVIECGGLRAAVRGVFGEVDTLTELSFKTVAKVEKNCCSFCLPRFEQSLGRWTEARFDPQDVDSDHVALFKESVRRNVQKGWDRYRKPFIPNGHATLFNGRKSGGNWNLEEFSEDAEACLVFSSGKPRVVTKYSSFNTSVLGELHYSLYTTLEKQGWLLVGDPTDQHVKKLRGADYVSVDYSSATDNIKVAYVKAAIEVLEEQADFLTDDELRCLRVLASLKLKGDNRVCTRGQPMGSVMSFPLLCLINKSVVDLALNQMLKRKEISFPEWSRHRCLINGDDLLTREVRSGSVFRGTLIEEGSKVGLVVNTEKTMSSANLAEINSKLFLDGKCQRKFNASSVWMDSDVSDVLGFAAQACPDFKSFRRVVRSNAHILAKQKDKFLDTLHPTLQWVCRVDRKIRRAIVSLPVTVRQSEQGPIRMAPRPEDYDLSSDDEREVMREEIVRVRSGALEFFSRRPSPFRTDVRRDAQSFSSVLKLRRTGGQEVLPACYLRLFLKKKWESQEEFGLATEPDPFCLVTDESRISYLIGLMRSRKRKSAVSYPGTYEIESDRVFRDTFRSNIDYVLLDC